MIWVCSPCWGRLEQCRDHLLQNWTRQHGAVFEPSLAACTLVQCGQSSDSCHRFCLWPNKCLGHGICRIWSMELLVLIGICHLGFWIQIFLWIGTGPSLGGHHGFGLGNLLWHLIGLLSYIDLWILSGLWSCVDLVWNFVQDWNSVWKSFDLSYRLKWHELMLHCCLRVWSLQLLVHLPWQLFWLLHMSLFCQGTYAFWGHALLPPLWPRIPCILWSQLLLRIRIGWACLGSLHLSDQLIQMGISSWWVVPQLPQSGL